MAHTSLFMYATMGRGKSDDMQDDVVATRGGEEKQSLRQPDPQNRSHKSFPTKSLQLFSACGVNRSGSCRLRSGARLEAPTYDG